jgi:acetoin utilization protein AcuC
LTGKTAIFYCDKFLEYNLSPTHPLRPVRVKLTFDLLKMKGVFDSPSVSVVEPRQASEDEIRLFHDREYVQLVQKYSDRGVGLLDMGDTPAFKGCYEATSLVVGASLKACDLVMEGKFSHAFNPSGGLHHAHPERASGFCIFNDPAISIKYLQSKHHVKKLVYLDIDAHHGDGVMYGFYNDAGVLDIDFHESGKYLFPGTGFPDEIGAQAGEGFKANIPLPPETGDEAYLAAFREFVPETVERFKPEIILVQCGADGHFDDRLAQLRLSTETYRQVVLEMHRLAHELCQGRFLLFGGGGYTLANVPRVWAVAFATLAGLTLDNVVPEEWAREFASSTGQDPPSIVHDSLTNDSQQTRREVERALASLKSNLDRKSHNQPTPKNLQS